MITLHFIYIISSMPSQDRSMRTKYYWKSVIIISNYFGYREQRVTGIVVHFLIGLSILFTPLLKVRKMCRQYFCCSEKYISSLVTKHSEKIVKA